MLTRLAFPALLLLLALLVRHAVRSVKRSTVRLRQRPQLPSPCANLHRFAPPKPPWVRREVLRLKAWMPDAGCRRIAITFNHLHAHRRKMTVGKTFVATVLRDSGEGVLRLRRQLRRRRPRWMPRNLLWGLDWTFVPGGDGRPRPVLGVIDHGTRACLELRMVQNRRTVALLQQLLDLFARFGTPKVLRTDNEPACRSLLFRFALRFLGVRPQRTAPFAPWQNGRIERLFGTVKEARRRRAERIGETASLRTT